MAESLGLIVLAGLLADAALRRTWIPGLVGMLLVGVVVGPYVLDLLAPDMMRVSADFRMIALVVILLRAGFELRRDTLNRVGAAGPAARARWHVSVLMIRIATSDYHDYLKSCFDDSSSFPRTRSTAFSFGGLARWARAPSFGPATPTPEWWTCC